ncbi:MAG: general secretion pathway protein GspB [Arenimonas sp.]|uniref:general secretion pathway protein GspB n=1 Tax=Arenimonas sp. TaxID=1872635 RepID=UPI0025C078AB|nr:general secretion pathway protein GspB [Arenimonas sp.]MBW8367886.1 general secretion pathway protein GspB [Arenimonas sp.]
MSMILEALRKSEAERQRGRAPGLFVEQQLAHSRQKRLPVWAWVLSALLVAVLLAWAWREWSRPASGTPKSVAAAGVAGTAAQPPPAPVSPPYEPAPSDPAALPSITLAPRPAPAQAPAPAASPAAAAQVPEPAASLAAPAAPRPETIVAPIPVAAPPAVTAAPEALPGLGALAAGERAALPPLKLSMHVFAEDPGQRFVILDGQRLGQGASPAAGVVLEEIRRDGLVLSVNGQRLLLARP